MKKIIIKILTAIGLFLTLFILFSIALQCYTNWSAEHIGKTSYTYQYDSYYSFFFNLVLLITFYSGMITGSPISALLFLIIYLFCLFRFFKLINIKYTEKKTVSLNEPYVNAKYFDDLKSKIMTIKSNSNFIKDANNSKTRIKELQDKIIEGGTEVIKQYYSAYRISILDKDIAQLNLKDEYNTITKTVNNFFTNGLGDFGFDVNDLPIKKIITDDITYLFGALAEIQNEMLADSNSTDSVNYKIKHIKNFMDYSEENKQKWICPNCKCFISSYPCICCGYNNEKKD